MKEFVEKLIGRLEEEKLHYFLTIANTGDEKLDAIYEAVVNAIDTNILIVNQLAEEYNNGWIPCSERLPEKDMWCLATFESGNVDKIQYLVTNNWGWNGMRGDNKVIAWMPLPAPYQK